jgi:hypothetical protein
MEEKREEEQSLAHVRATLTGLDAAHTVHLLSETIIKGTAQATNVAIAKKRISVEKRRGYVAEELEVKRINEEAFKKRLQQGARTTASDGRSRDSVDIEILKNGKVVKRVQMKHYTGETAVERAVRQIVLEKYQDSDEFVVPKAIADEVKAKLRERASRAQLEDEARRYQDVESKVKPSRVSTLEVEIATRFPVAYATYNVGKATVRETGTALPSAIRDAAAFSASIEAVGSLPDVLSGQSSLGDAIERVGTVAADSVKAQVAHTLASVTVRNAAETVAQKGEGKFAGAWECMKKSHGPVNQSIFSSAVADMAICATDALDSLCKGELTVAEAGQRIIADAFRTAYRHGLSALLERGLPVLGLGPAAPAAFVGFVVCSVAKKVVADAVIEAERAKAEADQLQELSQVICAESGAQRAMFEGELAIALKAMDRQCESYELQMDAASARDDCDAWCTALHGLLSILGVDARLMTRDEFDAFMLSDETVFRM